ncbi:MAG: c-type cytochrome biogenesis protein CcmF [Gemmatimonadetes bacterium]|nr:MAG: c-type cytochrome biogenesis protein CcmF [Gemmatimonadota bacterium]
MIPEIGQLALILALLLAAAQATLPLIGVARRVPAWVALARSAAQGQFLFIAVAFACLAWSFVTNDFSVANVASNSNSRLPVPYRFAATWGSHEGSMLLWVLMLAAWSVAVALFSRHLPEETVARVLGVMGIVSCGFLLFMLLTSNPFDRVFPPPPDGRDLNPLLQDPGMVMHPPMLYMGYVGFSVAFSFAVAALLAGRLDSAWARWSRPWTTAAWCFLTCGIMLGSWWAYYELGWGGWWFWDPVENASFMPWLVGTALIHSLAVTEKRGAFRSWTVLLAILAFSLSLLGTFLVRSGVLTSVHAFATDPARGVFILAFLTFVIGGSLALFAARAHRVGGGGGFDPVSRETMLLGNNVLLVAAAGSVLLGTLYPLALDVLGLGKISVGPPYFDSVFVPLMTPLVFLMGLGPLARWKQASPPELWARLKWALAIAIATALLLPAIAGKWSPFTSLGFGLAAWIAAATVAGVRERIRNAQGGWLSRLGEQPRAWWGMTLAHLGVAVFVTGVTVVKSYEIERDVRVAPGDAVTVGGYAFRFMGVSEAPGPNYRAVRGMVEVSRDGRLVRTLYPEKRVYLAQSQMPTTEAAIATGILGDLYVSLGEPVGEGAWTMRVYHKPFVTWIWGGCLLMALGGFCALSDRRYRVRSARAETVAGAAAAG